MRVITITDQISSTKIQRFPNPITIKAIVTAGNLGDSVSISPGREIAVKNELSLPFPDNTERLEISMAESITGIEISGIEFRFTFSNVAGTGNSASIIYV